MSSTPPTRTSAAAEPEPETGEIITFYSYKGGTGRSMALANVGCLLAQRTSGPGRGVLLVDWDLEAPGLHRYFQHLFADGRAEDGPEGRPGLIDLFAELEREVPPDGYGDEDEAAEDALRLAEEFSARRYALPLQVPGLFLLKAGRFDDGYSELVNTFDWAGLYRRSPHLFRALAARWADEFDYVLIDSRTGVTDTSGICTILMPEKLVVVFTPNRQSFTGVANLVRKATRHRKGSDDLRPLIVFPLPSRIEASLQELRNIWRFGDAAREVEGYQPLFETLFREVYGPVPDDPAGDGQPAPERFDLGEYFEEVQVQQTPDYAYGEEIAVLVEKQRDRFSLTRSYQTFAARLVRSEGPWERSPEEMSAEAKAEEGKRSQLLTDADVLYAGLRPEEREDALRLLARLVNVAPPGEGGRDTAGHFKQARLEEASRRAVGRLVAGGLVKPYSDYAGEEPALIMADDALVNEWGPLREWLGQNRDFLFWRQNLRNSLREWEQGGRIRADLLSGSALNAAGAYLRERPQDISQQEKSYIEESLRAEKARERRNAIIIATVGLSLLAAVVALVLFLRSSANTNPSVAPPLTYNTNAAVNTNATNYNTTSNTNAANTSTSYNTNARNVNNRN
jgi:cellulose biosynthesis protein BcsQ